MHTFLMFPERHKPIFNSNNVQMSAVKTKKKKQYTHMRCAYTQQQVNHDGGEREKSDSRMLFSHASINRRGTHDFSNLRETNRNQMKRERMKKKKSLLTY